MANPDLVNQSIRYNLETGCDELFLNGEWLALDAGLMSPDELRDSYPLALAAGFEGTQDEWISQLVTHALANDLAEDAETHEEGPNSDVLSNYEAAAAGFDGVPLADPEAEGPSAYELAVKGGFVGTEEEFIEALKYGAEQDEQELEAEFEDPNWGNDEDIKRQAKAIKTIMIVLTMIVAFFAYKWWDTHQMNPTTQRWYDRNQPVTTDRSPAAPVLGPITFVTEPQPPTH